MVKYTTLEAAIRWRKNVNKDDIHKYRRGQHRVGPGIEWRIRYDQSFVVWVRSSGQNYSGRPVIIKDGH